jgi:polysaccharide pyruvyl transferase WcaK-like protein
VTSSFGPGVIELRLTPGQRLARQPDWTQLTTLIVLVDGVPDSEAIRELLALYPTCTGRNVQLFVDFELDAGADAFAALGRGQTSLRPLLDASRELRIKGVDVRWRVPLIEPLVYRLEGLFSLADDERVDAILLPAGGGPSGSSLPNDLDADSERFVRDFLTYRLLGEERWRLMPARLALYQALHDTLNDVAPDGGVVRAALDEGPHPSAWDPTRKDEDASEKGTAGVLAEGLRAVIEWTRVEWTQALSGRRPAAAKPVQPLPRVLVIGAYGGEHIGDAAILGGVLLRMHRRYGTTHAVLMSQRPDHTRHLVPMLDLPVRVVVEEYQQTTVAALLDDVDGVVFAGGPLMDLPRQLVKHLYTVSLARRRNKPFIVEGIGAGPFLLWPSEWTARRLVRMADRISVRTSEDARVRLVSDLSPEVGRDPAFDYLESRGDILTKLPDVDRQWLDLLLRDTEGRTTIGLNLRPIKPVYTVGTTAENRADYTRFIESRFETRLVESMRRLHKAFPKPPCFIFFPMNAIQFGMCDLRSAYRLQRQLRGEVDFRVWEGDASIDGVIALLRRLDIVITMRFHATIYALAQRRRVVGIDYRVGKRDKVASLLDDAGHRDSYRRVDEMTTDWLVEQCAGQGRSDAAAAPAAAKIVQLTRRT